MFGSKIFIFEQSCISQLKVNLYSPLANGRSYLVYLCNKIYIIFPQLGKANHLLKYRLEFERELLFPPSYLDALWANGARRHKYRSQV